MPVVIIGTRRFEVFKQSFQFTLDQVIPLPNRYFIGSASDLSDTREVDVQTFKKEYESYLVQWKKEHPS